MLLGDGLGDGEEVVEAHRARRRELGRRELEVGGGELAEAEGCEREPEWTSVGRAAPPDLHARVVARERSWRVGRLHAQQRVEQRRGGGGGDDACGVHLARRRQAEHRRRVVPDQLTEQAQQLRLLLESDRRGVPETTAVEAPPWRRWRVEHAYARRPRLLAQRQRQRQHPDEEVLQQRHPKARRVVHAACLVGEQRALRQCSPHRQRRTVH
mmetsp:Transcript_11773/g.37405  ORF Transcript_11773/g.37405 Transcript_11773/m.37405 type:complete len:212 (-) Transcript_11773:207-842(-)